MPFQDYVPKEATVSPAGAVFPPDLIELMKLVLNDVTALLPELKRTSSIKLRSRLTFSHVLQEASEIQPRSKQRPFWGR
jgi:hypothetical protein